MSNQSLDIALGLVIILLGLSFSYKFFLAGVLGRVSYWTGFIPFTIVSPFLLHIPATSKRSLVRSKQGLWVHLLMAPVFLICAVLCFAAGADIMGLPGVKTLNWVLTGGNVGRPSAVCFDRHNGYRFPCLVRAKDTLGVRIGKVQLYIPEDKRLLPENNPRSVPDQMQDAKH